VSKILLVAKLTFLLNVRNRSLYGGMALVCGIAALIFFASSGDNELINELQLRLQYSYAIAYSLLTLIVMAVACFTVRAQIDGRQMHMLDSRPISRRDIWLGKWLGIIGIALVLELALAALLLISSVIYMGSYDDKQVAEAKRHFSVARYDQRPVAEDINLLTRERINKLVAEGKVEAAAVDQDTWEANHKVIRRSVQLLQREESKTWRFDLGRKPSQGQTVTLRLRVVSENRLQKVPGTVKLTTPGQLETFSGQFAVYPYDYHDVEIPLAQIPAGGRFDITVTNLGKTDVIVEQSNGLRILYDDGGLAVNLMRAGTMQMIHLAVVAAVALAAGVAFTFPVASFVAMVLYFLSISATFFSDVVTEIMNETYLTFFDRIAVIVINGGMWLAKGLQPPPITSQVSAGVAVPIDQLLLLWLPAIFAYGTMTVVIGVMLLRSKELDKLF
jgi:hypothetical protein